MPNSWKDSWLSTDVSSCYLYSCQKIVLCLHLNDTFGKKWVERGDPISWPSRSPDLTPLEFHFWGHMKTLVYESPMGRQQVLVAQIRVAAGVILDLPGILPRVWHDIIRRYKKMYRSWWRPYLAASVMEWNGDYWQYFNCFLYSYPSISGPNCLWPLSHFRDVST